MFGERLGQPRRKMPERVPPGVLETRELQRLISPDRLDELRARAIRARGDVPDERRRFERHTAIHQWSDNQQPLPRLQVEGDLDGNLAVSLEFLLGFHFRTI